MIESLLGAFTLIILGYMIGSVRIIDQGDEALVQRLGQYKRTLKPGLNFVIPFMDTVLIETVREQLLDIDPQPALTKDNVPIEIDAIIFWRIVELKQAYYAVEDLEEALKQMVITSLRGEIGRLTLEEAVSSTNRINTELRKPLDEAARKWGIEVIRVEVQAINLSSALRDSLEREQIAKSEKKAALSRTEATVQSIEELSRALQAQPNAQEVLRYLVAKDYVNANLEIGKSDNSKIVFMHPGALTEAVTDLMRPDQFDQEVGGSSDGNSTN